jgi:uridine kinase
VKELAKEYKASMCLLSNRIKELVSLKIQLQESSKDPEKDPDVIDLNDRINKLSLMQRDTQEVTKEVEHYFDRWWWRSEKYTLNSRKARKFIYAGPSRR